MADHHAAHAQLRDQLELAEGVVGVVAWDATHADQPGGCVGAEVGEPPVVGGEPGPRERRVLAHQRRLSDAAEEDLGPPPLPAPPLAPGARRPTPPPPAPL